MVVWCRAPGFEFPVSIEQRGGQQKVTLTLYMFTYLFQVRLLNKHLG